MIIDIFIYFLSLLLQLFALVPDWLIYPDAVFNAINYIVTVVMKFNILFPVDTVFQAINFLLNFFSYYFIFRILLMFINWMRGTGEIKI